MSNYGRETITLLEIDQPFCARIYGDAFFSPSGGCSAQLGTTGDRKCYNTQATCQDPNNYLPGTLTLRFGRDQEGLLQYGAAQAGSPSELTTPVLPCIRSVQTTPARINLGAMDRNASPLGQREVITIDMEDFRHSDLIVDKYRLERATGAAAAGSPSESFDPYTRGTFWGKWLARNPYHANYNCRLREGYMGDTLDDMRVRRYVIDRIDGPNGDSVRLVAKDEFSRIERRKSVAPSASRGELAGNIGAASVNATLNPVGIGNLDYPFLAGSPTELFVRIGDEIMRCTRSGDVLTFTQRGAFGTSAAEHDDEDLVQWVLVYQAQSVVDILYDLLTEYSAIPAALIDLAEWEAQAVDVTQLYTGAVTEPTPVSDLLGELCEQAGVTIWADPVTGMIKLKALRATAPTPTVDDNAWLVEDSFESKLDISKRVSQVHVYYGQRDVTGQLDDRKNYTSRLVLVDLDAEDEQQYGTPAIREIFSRWIPQFGRDSAEETAARILSIFRNPPHEITFTLDASRDGELDLATLFYLEAAEFQDDTGDLEPMPLAPIELRRGENDISVRAMEVQFADVSGAGVVEDQTVIYIENPSFNLNLRTIYDSLYPAPVGTSPPTRIRFIVIDGITIGSTSISSSALRTGSWPSGIELTLENHGRIQGKGGNGGNNLSFPSGNAGEAGGIALLAEDSLFLDNSDGQLWGGGGGGGGGGDGGGGGGGGAGTNAGSGGSGTNNGEAGTDTTGGAGGFGGVFGDGGAGGGPGIAGSAGVGGAAGGAAGAGISGIANVSWVGSPNGDVRGGTV